MKRDEEAVVVTFHGTGVVEGVAFGPAVWAHPANSVVLPTDELPAAERDEAQRSVARAAESVAERLAQRADASQGAAAEVLAATAELARDKGWLRAIATHVADGRHPTAAVAAASDHFIAMFEHMGGRMAERTTDLRDVRDRVIAELAGLPEPGVPVPETPSVLCATDLAPADTASLDASRILAIVTELGGPTSHTAIIARQRGIPCVVGVAGLSAIQGGTAVVVRGGQGTVETGVSDDDARTLVVADERRRRELASWRGPAHTRDGRRVELLANVSDGASAVDAATVADGVGLFRTELRFLTASHEPTLAEQTAAYAEVFDAFAGRKVVVRTFDAGSDKPLAFAALTGEENPALGVRGFRVEAAHPGLTGRQLDAVAAAASGREAWVMAPMVATVDEAREFAAMARARGLTVGVMIEVPAAALMASALLAEVDFVSLGTNDLTQYTMAADRLSPAIADLTDPWQPAVLGLVARVAQAGAAADKPVGVCGEAASDPLLACVLVGLGVTSLSMAASALPAVGLALAKVSVDECGRAAHRCLEATRADEARHAAVELLRAGDWDRSIK